MHDKKDKMKGSLLVEIMVVVVIVGLLAGLKAPDVYPIDLYVGGTNRSINSALQIWKIENALDIYYRNNGIYQTTEQGIEALVIIPAQDPQSMNYADEGYLRRVPLDPWGNPFIYRSHGEKGPIDIISCGPDGKEGTGDDITNHNMDSTLKRRH